MAIQSVNEVEEFSECMKCNLNSNGNRCTLMRVKRQIRLNGKTQSRGHRIPTRYSFTKPLYFVGSN